MVHNFFYQALKTRTSFENSGLSDKNEMMLPSPAVFAMQAVPERHTPLLPSIVCNGKGGPALIVPHKPAIIAKNRNDLCFLVIVYPFRFSVVGIGGSFQVTS